jgi:transmembrane sensor
MTQYTSDAVAMEAAIDWMVQLRAGRVTDKQWQQFEQWRNSDASHHDAWQRLEARLGQSAAAIAQLNNHVPGQREQMRHLLAKPGRRAILRTIALVATGAGTMGLSLDRFMPVSQLAADLRTRTGQRETFTLPDQSLLTLNARSAANLAFTDHLRQVTLLAGDAVVEVAAIRASATSRFCVQTRHGQLYPDKRVSVRLLDDCTQIVALDGAVRVQTHAGQIRDLVAGQGTEMDAQGLRENVHLDASQADWVRGVLTAAPLPLGDVIAGLQRYTPMVLHVSAAAARLSVHASLPLDDVDKALAALADTLPIRMQRVGNLLVRMQA